MIVIAIDGNPGSGKTTVSETMLQGENVEVVHLDLMFENIKKNILPSKVSQKFKRTTGEEITGINQESNLYKFLHSKKINTIYKFLKEKYTARVLNRICLDALIRGVRYLIIEGTESIKYDNVCLFNYKILVSSPLDVRIKRLRERTNDFDEANVAEVTKDITMSTETYDFVIENNGSLEELYAKALQVAKSITEERPIVLTREKQKNENNY